MTLGYVDMTDGKHVETGWLQTFTGKKFYPLVPDADQVDVFDIAHALSCEARFNGHTYLPYFVGQHSVLASRYCVEYPLEALFHDAAEAYLKDLPRPLKKVLKAMGINFYAEAENWLMGAVAKKIGFQYPLPPEVEAVDRKMLVTESRDLFRKLHPDWHYCEANGYEPFKEKVIPWDPIKCEKEFLIRYGELTGNYSHYDERFR